MRCEHCRTALSGHIFPALESGSHLQIQRGERALEGDAVCFFHPEKRAEQSCSRCGRFVCGLCEMPVGREHLCPTCLGSGLESGKMEELTPRRIVWGQMALLVGGLPLLTLMWPFYVITGPAAIGLAIYGWKKPGSLVNGRRRVAASFAIFFGLLQIAACAFVFYAIRSAFAS